MTEKEIKQKIRALKKIKKDLRSGTKERLDLGRQIKVLKQQLTEARATPEPLKEPLIKDILKIEAERKIIPTFEQLGINLSIYSIEQLKKHLQKLNTKREVYND